jgi:flagellar assembly protein FliH
MAFARLIPFDRPLDGAVVAGRPGRYLPETEVAARTQAAYREGVDAARAAADQQMVEFRAELAQLGDTVLARLAAVDGLLLAQLRDSLPGLAVELARRLLAGYEPPPEVVARLCEETLEQLFPERDGLELALCPRDADLLAKLDPSWRQRYPDLRIRPDPALAPGDCQVRSRFGLTDARQSTKLAALAHQLTGAA